MNCLKGPKTKILFLALIFFVVFFPNNVSAYLDPGTGSLIVQAVIAATVAVGFYLKLYWRKIISFFKKDKDKEKENKEEVVGESK